MAINYAEKYSSAVDDTQMTSAAGRALQRQIDEVITHRLATTAPQKLADYKIHDNPPGINGWLVEGRVYYDAFVLDNKKNAIYVHKSA